MLESPPAPPRLDSWKEIAAYLGRDVRTAMRWAKTHGLPVRRVAAAKGSSVFAFTADVDNWLAAQAPGAPAPVPAPARPRAAVWKRTALWVTAGVAITGAAAILPIGARWLPADPFGTTATLEGATLTITSPRGAKRTIQPFGPSTIVAPVLTSGGAPLVADIDDDGVPEVLVAFSSLQSAVDRTVRSGGLAAMKTSGDLRWRFELNDTMRFGGRPFAPPWSAVDWQISPGPGPRRIAVAAHHYLWWPGLVALLDARGRLAGSFVNPGWVESVRWIDDSRLAVAGFDNARDGGMFAVLDGHHPSGRSPGPVEGAFACEGCPAGDPLLYVTFARSELNLAAAAPFNRARVQVLSDRIVATTSEMGEQDPLATAIYEFDLSLNVVRSDYSDRYWEAHRRLELDGRLHHAREHCPDRHGPRAIGVWTRAGGWRHPL